MTAPADTTATIIPCLRYRDARAAIGWLCRAFGCEKQAVYADGDTVHHAQLVFGNGMVMLGSTDNTSEWGQQIAQPDEIGMRDTQSPCVIVADTDAHYARAKAAGATIVMDVADQDDVWGGYSCRDVEGDLWWFGSYAPWRDPGGRPVRRAAAQGRGRHPRRHWGLDVRALAQQLRPIRPGAAPRAGIRQAPRQ